jgi:hypothetical protein
LVDEVAGLVAAVADIIGRRDLLLVLAAVELALGIGGGEARVFGGPCRTARPLVRIDSSLPQCTYCQSSA